MPEQHKPVAVTEIQSTEPDQQTTAALVLGILSLVLILVPFIGFTLGLIGLVLAIRKFRKIVYTEDGYRGVFFLNWSKASGQLKAAFITSMLGTFGFLIVLIFITAIARLT